MSRGHGHGESGLGVEDRLALRELVDAYAFAADRGDGKWFRSLWLPDARLTIHNGDGPARSTMDGVDAIGQVTDLLRKYVVTLHVVANHICRPDPDGGEDSATGEAYCVAHHVSAPATAADEGGHDDYVMAIRYIDRYGRDGGGRWRFATREIRRQWTRHEPVRARTAGGPA